MVILSVIIALFVFWLFTSSSKSNDIQRGIKSSKDVIERTTKILENGRDGLDGISKNVKKSNLKKIKENLIYLSELGCLEETNQMTKKRGLGVINEDVTLMVESFKEAGRFNEISHLVIEVDKKHKKLNKNFKYLYKGKDRYISKRKLI